MPFKNIQLSQTQADFLASDSRSTLFQAGLGSGKTWVGTIWVCQMAFQHPGSTGLIISRDYPQLRTAVLPQLHKTLTEIFELSDADYQHNKSNNTITFSNGSTIYCASSNNYDSLRGVNLNFAWADELDYFKADAFKVILGRLRLHPEQFKATSTPKGFNHVWEYFFQHASDDRKVIHSTSYDSLFLSDAYIAELKASYSPKLFSQEVLAERLALNSGAIYSEFSREKHVKPCRDELGPDDLLDFHTDYNIAHYRGVYSIFKNGTLYVIGEEALENQNTRVMAETVRNRYPNHHITVRGDSTGNNKRDVAATKTNYEIFREAGLATKHTHNPPVQARVIAVENALYHGKVIIDPSCTHLIRDLELVSWKDGTNEIDKTDPKLTHSSDAFGYAVWTFLPLKREQPKTTTHYR